MGIFTDKKDVEALREGGRRLAVVLDKVIAKAVVGTTPKELDRYAEELIRAQSDTPAFLRYTPKGARTPYPATLCVSVNDAVVHGIPRDMPFKEGDIVGIDIGLFHEKIAVDMAKTIPIGIVSEDAKKLLLVTEEALYAGIKKAHAGRRLGDISSAIESHVTKNGFSIVRELGGHGIGYKLHENPFVPNFGKKRTGPILKEGMMLALEPIVNQKSPAIVLDKDGYTYRTVDEKLSAHFEHTILITARGPEIITKNV